MASAHNVHSVQSAREAMNELLDTAYVMSYARPGSPEGPIRFALGSPARSPSARLESLSVEQEPLSLSPTALERGRASGE